MKVSEVMTTSIYQVSSNKSVFYASNKMNEWETDSLIVVDHGTVVGIMTSRDVRSSHPNRIVADAMTPDPVTISPDIFIWDALKVMASRRIKRLLVMESGRPLGLATMEEIRVKLSLLMDPMTGLYRAPYIESIGEDFLRKKRTFHLVFLDLNEFGKINKRYGHPLGDDVIRGFSQSLASLVVEERDYLCRYAGDEFVIITQMDEAELNEYILRLSQPILIQSIPVSAGIGWVNGTQEPGFLNLSFRDILHKASLLSTSAKNRVM